MWSVQAGAQSGGKREEEEKQDSEKECRYARSIRIGGKEPEEPVHT